MAGVKLPRGQVYRGAGYTVVVGTPVPMSLPSDALPPNNNSLLRKADGMSVVGIPITFAIWPGTTKQISNADFTIDASVQIAGSVGEDEGPGWYSNATDLGTMIGKILKPGSQVTQTFAFTVQNDEPAISLTVGYAPIGVNVQSHTFAVAPSASILTTASSDTPTAEPAPEATSSTSPAPLALGQTYHGRGLDMTVGRATRVAGAGTVTFRCVITVNNRFRYGVDPGSIFLVSDQTNQAYLGDPNNPSTTLIKPGHSLSFDVDFPAVYDKSITVKLMYEDESVPPYWDIATFTGPTDGNNFAGF